MTHPVVGVWRLSVYEIERPDGSRYRPFGDHPVGLLVYTAEGYVSAQLAHPVRPTFERGQGTGDEIRATFENYIAYFGTYTLAEDGKSVVNHPEASLQPWRDRIDQPREMMLEGDRLTLEAEVDIRGLRHNATLTWARA